MSLSGESSTQAGTLQFNKLKISSEVVPVLNISFCQKILIHLPTKPNALLLKRRHNGASKSYSCQTALACWMGQLSSWILR